MVLTRRKILLQLLLLLLLLAAISLLSLSIGAASIAPSEVVTALLHRVALWSEGPQPEVTTILFDLRLPRLGLALIVGMALAVAGAAYQALLRNPLADPHVLGISSGAALAAILAIAFGPKFSVGTPIAAFAGALITLALVFFLGGSHRHASTQTLLLAGIVTASFFSAWIIFLETFLSGRQLREMTFWLLGDFSMIDVTYFTPVALLVLLATVGMLFLSSDLNVLLTGEREALHLGVNVVRVKRLTFLLAALLTGLAVSVSGSIGYLGLLVPHIVRMAFGNDYRLLIPASALAGGAFAVLADGMARTVLAPTELPVGAVTALAGAPVFIYLLRRQSSNHE